MNRLLILVLLIVALPLQTASADTVYHLLSNTAYQNGYTLTGTITTDGTMGYLTPANMIASEWQLSKGDYTSPVITVTYFLTDWLIATPTDLRLPDDDEWYRRLQLHELPPDGNTCPIVTLSVAAPVGSYVDDPSSNFLRWDRDIVPDEYYCKMDGAPDQIIFPYQQYAWYGMGNPSQPSPPYGPANGIGLDDPWIIATTPNVPEPSTLLIWSLLGGLGIAFASWRRKRAA